MSQSDFQARLDRLRVVGPAPDPTPRAAAQPAARPARNRTERVNRALEVLAQNGVTGAYAYAPVFHGLAKLGMPPKPLFFRSAFGLFLFAVALFAALVGIETFISGLFDMRPKLLGKLDRVGPVFFFGVIFVASVGFAAFHRVKAIQMDLPKWKDL